MSFSCDACQNVFTKPKVLRHFQNCRTQSVSCIDCSAVFNSQSVRAHSSCVTEAEKYGPKGGSTACTQAFCGICKLALNGAVHALQHYESKKHRSSERKLKTTQNSDVKAKKPDEASKTEQGAGISTHQKAIVLSATSPQNSKGKEKSKKSKIVKKAMKNILKKQSRQKLKRDGLVKAVAEMLGKDAPENLGSLVDKKALKSTSFKMRNGVISLVALDT